MKQLPTDPDKLKGKVFFELMWVFILSATAVSAIDMYITPLGNYKSGFVFLAAFSYLIYIFIRINSDGENE